MGFIDDSLRVLHLTRKPTREEYVLVAKVTGAGLVVIGLIGTVISLLAKFVGL
jgi:protein transport protein SEC61 subunit gamma-like protein